MPGSGTDSRVASATPKVIKVALTPADPEWSWAMTQIWDHLDGKPMHQPVTAEVNEKRSEFD
jgi:hypothetical protein